MSDKSDLASVPIDAIRMGWRALWRLPVPSEISIIQGGNLAPLQIEDVQMERVQGVIPCGMYEGFVIEWLVGVGDITGRTVVTEWHHNRAATIRETSRRSLL